MFDIFLSSDVLDDNTDYSDEHQEDSEDIARQPESIGLTNLSAHEGCASSVHIGWLEPTGGFVILPFSNPDEEKPEGQQLRLPIREALDLGE